MIDSHRRKAANEGFVLVAVLGLLVLLSAVMLMLLSHVRNSLDTAILSGTMLRRDALIQSAISVAAYELFFLAVPPERLDGQKIVLDDGVASFSVGTDAGRVDLNTSGAVLLAAAYRAAGLTSLQPESFAARVIDWRDDDDDVSDQGAEASAYAAAGLDYGPRNGAFRAVEDLKWVLGVSGTDLEGLRPLVTIYNPKGTLEVFSTSPSLIAALPKVATQTVEQVVSARASHDASSIDALTFLLLRQSSLIDMASPVSFRVLIQVRGNGDAVARQAEVVLSRGATPDAPYHVLSWVEKP